MDAPRPDGAMQRLDRLAQTWESKVWVKLLLGCELVGYLASYLTYMAKRSGLVH